MVKKGLSLEQKRDKVLEIFHESDEVYQLKEIEKIASGRGVVLQSVKEVVQSLVDDGLVHQVCAMNLMRLYNPQSTAARIKQQY
jgi:Fe2+ or Zn2+ uptake regulation protein